MRTLILQGLTGLFLCAAIVLWSSCATRSPAGPELGPVSFQPGTLRLDTAFVGGRAASGVVTITNRKKGSLTVEGLTGDCPGEITWSLSDSRLLTDESMTATFRFDPKEWSEETTCTLTPVISTEPTASNSVLVITFAAGEAACALSPGNRIEFGEVPLASAEDRTLTLSNSTTEDLPENQFGYQFRNPTPDCRLFPMDPADEERILGPGESREVMVRFQPDAIGTFECTRELVSWRMPVDLNHPLITNRCPTEVSWQGTGKVGPPVWSTCMPGGNNDLYAVWGLSGSEIYVAGDGGSVLASGGNCEWLPFGTPPADVDLRAIWAHSTGTGKAVWAVGNIPPPQGLNQATGAILKSDGALWNMVDEDEFLTYEAVWGSGFDDVYFAGFGVATDFPNAKRWNGGVLATLNISEWRWSTVSGVSGTAGNDVWAVLEQDFSSVIRFQGTGWEAQNQAFMNKPLHDVWARQGTGFYAVYAVGVDGAIYHYDGNLWNNESIVGETSDFHGVWVSPTGQVIVVGEGQKIYRGHVNEPGSWTIQNLPIGIPAGNLTDVWGADDDKVFAVGTNGVILRYAPGG